MKVALIAFAWLAPCPITQATAILYLTWQFCR